MSVIAAENATLCLPFASHPSPSHCGESKLASRTSGPKPTPTHQSALPTMTKAIASVVELQIICHCCLSIDEGLGMSSG